MSSEVNQLNEMVTSLEEQLVSLYNEKQTFGDPVALSESIKNLDSQLTDLYSEKQEWTVNPLHAQETVNSLESQVISLIDEKMELTSQVESLKNDLMQAKTKAKALGAAVFEASLFTENHFKKVS